MKFIKSFFVVCSLLLFAGVVTSCEEEEIIVQKADGETVVNVDDIEG